MTAAQTPRRTGPRPLSLHLATAYMTWTGSYAGLTLWKSGLPSSKPEAQSQAATPDQTGKPGQQDRPDQPGKAGQKDAAATLDGLLREIDALDPGDFSESLIREVRGRLDALITGIEAYRAHPYRRRLEDPPLCWQEGSARLLDYGAVSSKTGRSLKKRRRGRAILVVPSLINRAYILDLTKDRSLMRWLAGQGYQPYLIDWGMPDENELKFSLTDYVAGYLERALDSLLAETNGEPPVLMGYCMGGLLALALAQRRQDDVAGLALLATPWDFHAGESSLTLSQRSLAMAGYLPLAAQLGCLPVDALQSLFALQEPMAVARKFVSFSRLDPTASAAADFVALEDWINDGVPLPEPVARACLEGWYLQNEPAKDSWRIAGRAVVPADVTLPCLGVVPVQDRIVPPESAMALCRALGADRVLRPRSGHIGMLIGQHAIEDLWRPLARWLSDIQSP